MPIQTIIRGRVVEGPFPADTGTDEFAATFTIGDRQNGLFRGKAFPVEDIESCEVICRGGWTSRLLETVHENDSVIVVGELRVSAPFDRYDERRLVLVTVEADTVGIDLATE